MKKVGTWFLPDGEVHLAEWIERDSTGNYQAPHRANALKYVKKWRVAVDIGGHVGLWSRDFCDKFEHVHAFEPMPDHRECFVKNMVKDNYTLHPTALGDRVGTVRMQTEAHSTGGTHVAPNETGDTPLTTLDSYEIPVIDFMKLDCEAYEIYVLMGAKQTLLRCKPVICIEQKNQQYFGNPRYIASDYLKSLGAREVSRFKDDLVFAWP